MKYVTLLFSLLIIFSCSESAIKNQGQTNQIMLNYEVKAHSTMFLIDTLINLENHQSNTSKIDSILLSFIKTTDNSINLVNQESYKNYLLKKKQLFNQILKLNSTHNKDSLNIYTFKWRKLYRAKNKPKWQCESSDRKYCNSNRVKL